MLSLCLKEGALFFIMVSFCFAQIKKDKAAEDSTSKKAYLIDEVVHTYRVPQAIKRSVYQVKVISKEQIASSGALNLSDVLAYQPNIDIENNAQNGESRIKLLGFPSDYVKILVDGIPIVSTEGFGNNTDLSQISVHNIERIEIVEGAMSTLYGANALAGVVNIVTKGMPKGKDFSLQLNLQEASLAKSYHPFYKKGAHKQSISISNRWKPDLYTKFYYTYNHYTGFLGEKKGIHHQGADNKRGYDWLPKKQHHVDLSLNYTYKNKTHWKYNFNFMRQNLTEYENRVTPDIDIATGKMTPYAFDKDNITTRWVNSLSTNGTFLNGLVYQAYVSYQQNDQRHKTFRYYLNTDQKVELEEKQKESHLSVWTSKGIVNHFIYSRFWDFELGYDLVFEKMKGAQEMLHRDKQSIANYAFIASAHFLPFKGLSIRPGLRAAYSDKFSYRWLPEISLKYTKNRWTFGTNAGTAYRTPNIKDLYFEFIDQNHNILSNPDLTPENGLSLSGSLAYKVQKEGYSWNNKLSVVYMNLTDKIVQSVVAISPRQTIKNINIDRKRSLSLSWESRLALQKLNLGFGASLTGVALDKKNPLQNNDLTGLKNKEPQKKDFLYTPNLSVSLLYNTPIWGINLSGNYKYTGREYQFFESLLGKQEKGYKGAIHRLDASVQKDFFDKKLSLSIGAQNLLNITYRTNTIDNLVFGHGSKNNRIPYHHGRSFYLGLLCNL